MLMLIDDYHALPFALQPQHTHEFLFHHYIKIYRRNIHRLNLFVLLQICFQKKISLSIQLMHVYMF